MMEEKKMVDKAFSTLNDVYEAGRFLQCINSAIALCYEIDNYGGIPKCLNACTSVDETFEREFGNVDFCDFAMKLEKLRAIAYADVIEWDDFAESLVRKGIEKIVSENRKYEHDMNMFTNATLQVADLGIYPFVNRLMKGELKVVKK